MREISRLTWPLSILLQAIHRLKSIWMVRVSKCFGNTEEVVRSTMLLRQCHCCKGDMNVQGWCELSFRIKLKNPSLSTVSVETRFDDECNKEALNTCKVFPTVIKNITWNPNSRILVMLFFGFPISPYSIQPHVTTIGYTEAHVKTSESNLLSCYIQIIKP